jgi:hypothetical protein
MVDGTWVTVPCVDVTVHSLVMGLAAIWFIGDVELAPTSVLPAAAPVKV